MIKQYFADTDYNQLIEQLAKKIYDLGIRPDCVLAVARGGTRVGDILSRIFRVPLRIISASSYSDGIRGHLELNDSSINMLNLRGSVLIADDLVDSGTTLCEIFKLVGKLPNVTNCHTSVIWKKSSSLFDPDVFVNLVDSETWIIQPFEIYDNEDLSQYILSDK